MHGIKETLLLSVTPPTGIFVLSAIALAGPRNRGAAALACIGIMLVNLSVFYPYDAVLGSYERLRERVLYGGCYAVCEGAVAAVFTQQAAGEGFRLPNSFPGF